MGFRSWRLAERSRSSESGDRSTGSPGLRRGFVFGLASRLKGFHMIFAVLWG